MNHAFLITAYKNPEHLHALVKALEHPDHCFFIHIDRKSKLTDNSFIKALHATPGVAFAPDPINVNWAGISHLYAILSLMRMAVKAGSFSYFHTLSGADYPVKSLSEIRQFFLEHEGREFMNFMPLPSPQWTDGGLDRISYYQLYDVLNPKSALFQWLNPRIVALQKKLGIMRKLPTEFSTMYGGNIWWSLSSRAINIVLEKLEQKPQLMQRFRHCFCAEEILIPSILLNSDLKDKVIDNNLRYTDWSFRNGNAPANLDESDYEKIVNSNSLFARKFEYPVSVPLLTRLKEVL